MRSCNFTLISRIWVLNLFNKKKKNLKGVKELTIKLNHFGILDVLIYYSINIYNYIYVRQYAYKTI
jgi:hypothetical protein